MYQNPALSNDDLKKLAEAKLVGRSLSDAITRLDDTYGSWKNWQSWNLSGYLAHKDLKKPENTHILASAKCVKTEIEHYQVMYGVELAPFEVDLVDKFESPFVSGTYGYYSAHSVSTIRSALDQLERAPQTCE